MIAAAAMTGCATTGNSLYSWGSYEKDLYRYYLQADKRPEVVHDYLDFIAKLESRNQRPAPGLYAEAGTFLLLQGRPQEAIVYYDKEQQAWPESQYFMGKLIENLQEQ